MTPPLAAALLDFVLGMTLGAAGQKAGNRVALQGLTMASEAGGVLRVGIERLELSGLVLEGPVAFPPTDAQRPAGQAHVHVHPAAPPPATGLPPAPSAWSLAPLAGANGEIRAEIVDAHLIFDADVRVPIRQGEVDFNDATVAHVGPDSRMGVSRLGLYVDAPNGRSYLYQFSSAPLAGVQYERRGTRFGPWVAERGRLQLQHFGESLLRHPAGGGFMCLTDQARLLFDRTAVSGEVRLGDGRFGAPGVQADLAGRAEGRNTVRIHSEAVGRGLTLELAALSVRDAVACVGPVRLECAELAGALRLRLFVEGGPQLRFALRLDELRASGLRLHLGGRAHPG